MEGENRNSELTPSGDDVPDKSNMHSSENVVARSRRRSRQPIQTNNKNANHRIYFPSQDDNDVNKY